MISLAGKADEMGKIVEKASTAMPTVEKPHLLAADAV
jgi:hypothetical protein